MLLLLLTTALATIAHASTLPPRCEKGRFLQENKCVPCTLCPANTYIERTCSRNRDTVCASFTIENVAFGQKLEPVFNNNRNVTKEKEENVFRQNASECFINARKEDVLIKSLIAALVIVMLVFIGYIIVTKCCHTPYHKDQGSCDMLITTTQEESLSAPEPPRYFPPEANFVIGPDGTKIPEEQYLRNPMKALTGKGRSKVLVNSPHPSLHGRPFYGTAEVDMVSLGSASETSITMDV